MVRSSLPAESKRQIVGPDYEMPPAASETSTCPTCGEPLKKIPGGGLGCAVCLFRAAIGVDADVTQDSTRYADEFFGSYKIDRHPDGSLYQLGRSR